MRLACVKNQIDIAQHEWAWETRFEMRHLFALETSMEWVLLCKVYWYEARWVLPSYTHYETGISQVRQQQCNQQVKKWCNAILKKPKQLILHQRLVSFSFTKLSHRHIVPTISISLSPNSNLPVHQNTINGISLTTRKCNHHTPMPQHRPCWSSQKTSHVLQSKSFFFRRSG